MQPIQRLTLIALAFVVALGASVGIFLYISLLPHIELIGWIVAALVILGLGCAAALMVNFTLHKIARWRIGRNVIAVGDYLVYRHDDGSFTHLSGIHQQMSLPPPTVTVKEEKPDSTEAVLAMYDSGSNLRDIAQKLNMTYYAVQKITSQYRNS